MCNEAATHLNYVLPDRSPTFNINMLKRLRKANIDKNNLIDVIGFSFFISFRLI